jgi:hypothetical protein
MTTLLLMLMLGLSVDQQPGQERPRVPKDSLEVVVIGCLKGRVLAASDVRQTDVQSGVDIRSRSFRLAGKKDVMNEVKRQNDHLVEVTGLIKRSALDDPGVKIGKRITIGGGAPSAGSGKIPSAAANVVVMDVSSVRLRASSCT